MKSQQISYRKAVDSDKPFLRKLREKTMEEHLLKAGIPLSDEEHEKRISYCFESACMILLDQQPIGLLKIRQTDSHIEIIQFQILPAHQGKGLGKEVLASVWKRAKNNDLFVSLSVLKTNPAMRLYRRMGFKVVNETTDSFILHLK